MRYLSSIRATSFRWELISNSWTAAATISISGVAAWAAPSHFLLALHHRNNEKDLDHPKGQGIRNEHVQRDRASNVQLRGLTLHRPERWNGGARSLSANAGGAAAVRPSSGPRTACGHDQVHFRAYHYADH